MKTTVLLASLFLFFKGINAQTGFNDSVALSRNTLNANAMKTLGTFAVANIASGFVIANNTNGEAKYFWRMNAYWNFFNLGLAGINLLQTHKMFARKYSFTENYKAQQTMEKIYAINLGLDAAYITAAVLLRSKGKIATGKSKDQLKGYGSSIILQGALLGAMDLVMINLHHKNTRRMNDKLNNLELTAAPGALSLTYNF